MREFTNSVEPRGVDGSDRIRTSRMFPVAYNDVEGWNWSQTVGFLNQKECQSIIDWSQTQTMEFAKTVGETDGEATKEIRVAQGVTLPDTDFGWVYDRLAREIQLINNMNYHYDIVGMLEPIYMLKYMEFEPGLFGKYDWHRDTSGVVLRQRKISSIVQLSDPKDYSGCMLEFVDGLEAVPVEENSQGALITFSSIKQHRITQLTSGIRYSLVCWVSGPPFR